MKNEYGNWMPKWMVVSLKVFSFISLFISALFGALSFIYRPNKEKFNTLLLVISIVFLPVTLILYVMYRKFDLMMRTFDYGNDEGVSWKIINYVADKVELDGKEKKILDVGCGSGALTIACAKRNPDSIVFGVDVWSMPKYFSKEMCEKNADFEGVSNVEFVKSSAVSLDFEDEYFDAVVSNYVYHNIPGDKWKYLLETFRVLKKGGTFAIHDLFSKTRYGDMNKFIEKLKNMGFEKVELVDTTDGYPLTAEMAKKTFLKGSALLIGIK